MNFSRGLNSILLLLFCLSLSLNTVRAHHTVNYNAINGIAGNAVRKVFIDSSDRVWLGTENGLCLITSNGIQNIIYPREWANNQIWEIMETPDSCLWIGTFKGDLYLLKNGYFSSIELPASQDNRPLRRLYFKDGQIFVGTDNGLFVVDYKSRQFIPYLNIDQLANLQVMSFFVIRDKLYFNTSQHGFFYVDTRNQNYKRLKYDYFDGQGVFYTQAFGDSLLISRGNSNQNVPYNILSLPFENFFTRQTPIDSFEMNSLAWKLETTAKGDLYAACWGVNDKTGGLYRKNSTVMQKVNDEFEIESNRIWDLNYDAASNKLYVASLDKGLYIIDLNSIVNKLSLLNKLDILDIKIMDEDIYILSDSEIIKLKDGRIIKKLSYADIDFFMKHSKTGIDYGGVNFNMAFTLREIIEMDEQVGITSNRGLILLDRDLNPRDYIGGNGQIRASLLNNNDLIITTDYSMVRLFEDMGKGLHIDFPTQKASNPANVRQICPLNDSLYLLNSADFQLYLYKQNEARFSKLDNPENLKFPCFIEQLSNDSILFLDKSNQLYLGVFRQGKLIIDQNYKTEALEVSECYFLKHQDNWTFIGSNKGLHIMKNDTVYLINKHMGLPGDALSRTVQLLNDTLFLATSKGLYTIDLHKLTSIKLNKQTDNLQLITAGGNIQSFSPGQKIRLSSETKEIILNWEINKHPYPQNLVFRYRINNNPVWHQVVTPGKIELFKPDYGENSIYLEVRDVSLGTKDIIELLSIKIVRPFYKSPVFMFLLILLLFGTGLHLYFKTKITILHQKEQKAQQESSRVKQKLELLQFLLKPHFIFNALTSIQNLIIEQKTNQSLTYTNYFSKYLRGIMDSSGEELISLKDELKNIESYVNLEKLRFNEQIGLKFSIDKSLDTEQIYTVPFLFQPILENCFKHAFKDKAGKPEIRIEIKDSSKSILFTIADNGCGIKGLSKKDLLEKTSSKGLKIVESQLNKYYPGRYSFELLNHTKQGCCWQVGIDK